MRRIRTHSALARSWSGPTGMRLAALLAGAVGVCAHALADLPHMAEAANPAEGTLQLKLDSSLLFPVRRVPARQPAAARSNKGDLSASHGEAPADFPGLRNVALRLATFSGSRQQAGNTHRADRPTAHPSIGLMQAYEAALQNDPTYLAAVNEALAGQEARAIGFSNLLPTLSLSASTSQIRSDVTTTGASTEASRRRNEYPSSSFSVQVRQPLFNLDGLARYRQGIAQSSGSAALLTARRQELILRVVSLYVAAKYEEYQLAVAIAQRDADVAMYKASERRFATGEGNRPEMLEAQSKAAMAEAELLNARDRLNVARDTLSYVVGGKVEGLVDLSGEFPLRPVPPISFDEWRSIVLKSNLEIVVQRHVVEVAREEINKARAGHAPRLDAIASANKGLSETITTLNQQVDTQSIGLQLTIPLYSGGAVSALSRQASANYEKATAELDVKTNQILIELRKQDSLLARSAPLLNASDKSIAAAQLQIDATQAGVRAGANTNVDVLNAKKQIASAQRDRALARFSYLVAYLRLRQLAGTVSVGNLQEVAAYFRDATESHKATGNDWHIGARFPGGENQHP